MPSKPDSQYQVVAGGTDWMRQLARDQKEAARRSLENLKRNHQIGPWILNRPSVEQMHDGFFRIWRGQVQINGHDARLLVRQEITQQEAEKEGVKVTVFNRERINAKLQQTDPRHNRRVQYPCNIQHLTHPLERHMSAKPQVSSQILPEETHFSRQA